MKPRVPISIRYPWNPADRSQMWARGGGYVVCAAVRVVVAIAPEAEPAATAPTAASVATLANAAMAIRNFMVGLPCEGGSARPVRAGSLFPFHSLRHEEPRAYCR